MPDWFFDHGHLGWTLFAVLIYSGCALLAVDYIWRRITMPFASLLVASVVLWVIGLAVLIAFG